MLARCLNSRTQNFSGTIKGKKGLLRAGHGLKRIGLLLFMCGMGNSFGFDHRFSNWDKLLKAHVSVKGPVSTVQYKNIKASPRGLTQVLAEMEGVSRGEYEAWNPDQKLAFLINAYNIFTVKLIVDNYPVDSIKKLGSLFKSPWKKKFFKLLGEEQNLDGIEHDMIRKNYNEPRVHFSVVCASKGCPPLRNEAWLSTKLEEQFSSAAKVFLNDPNRNRYDVQANQLYLSMIFKWYGNDFVKKFGSVIAFVLPLIEGTQLADTQQTKVSFLDYDWSLNETP